jgi:hypothetical protein
LLDFSTFSMPSRLLFCTIERTIARVNPVSDRAEVRVIERRRRARLPLKSIQRLVIAGQIAGQKLQRDLASQPEVLGTVNRTHAPRRRVFSTIR